MSIITEVPGATTGESQHSRAGSEPLNNTTAQSYYEEIHPSRDPNWPFPCKKCPRKFAQKLHRHKQVFHATENLCVSVMNGTCPTIMAKNGSGNHKRKVKGGQMREVQEARRTAQLKKQYIKESVLPGQQTTSIPLASHSAM